MSAAVSKKSDWGPFCGSNGGRLAAGSVTVGSSFAAVVRDAGAGEDDGTGCGFVRSLARENGGPPEVPGHDLRPKGGAEDLVARDRVAGLGVPPGPGGGLRVGQGDGEVRVGRLPGREIGEGGGELDGDLRGQETAA